MAKTLPAAAPTAAADVAPGTIPPPAPVEAMPEPTRIRFHAAFPHLAPKPAGDHAPGIFLNRDGSTYTPRKRIGGQFSLMRVTIENMYSLGTRKEVFPLLWPSDQYGVKDEERVSAREEVIFDFEDECTKTLKALNPRAAGVKLDPLRQALEAKGLGKMFDQMDTSPGFNSAA